MPTGAIDTTAGTEALDQAHAAMVAALRDANGVSLQNLIAAHPVLGPLNLYHFVVALGLHDARHAAQIREIGRVARKRLTEHTRRTPVESPVDVYPFRSST